MFGFRALAMNGTSLDELRNSVLRGSHEPGLVLVQSHAAVRFPALCVHCGQPPTSTIRIERAFVFLVQSDGDTPNETVPSIDAFEVPFCEVCRNRYQAEKTPASVWLPLRRVLSGSEGFAGLVVMGIAGLFLMEAVRRPSLAPLLLGCLPLATGLWLLGKTWTKSRYMSVPAPTSVDMAVDFTPSLALAYEPAWRAFAFRSAEYASAFRQLNAAELWDPESVDAKAAAAGRNRESFRSNLIFGGIMIALLLWLLWREYAV